MLRSAFLRAKTLVSVPKTLASSGFVHRQLFSYTQSSVSPSIARDLSDTHGFPREAAETLASLINPKRQKNFPSVLAVFRDYGFDHSDISSVLIRQPFLLNVNADKTLKPKLDALVCHGIEGPILVQVVTSDPYLLRFSASGRLLPCLQCLSRFFGSAQRLVNLLLLRRGTWILHKFNPAMEVNVDTLRRNGVPEAAIVRLMLMRPRTLCRNPADFQSIMKEIQELGMDTNSSMFLYGLVTRAAMKNDKWESKVDVFKRFGWSEQELMQLFVKQPKVMEFSGERTEKSLEYFLNQLGWTKEDIGTYPSLLLANLEKRIIPRMSVLNVLVNEGLLSKKGVLQALLLTNDNFIAKHMGKPRDQSRCPSEVISN